MYSSRQEGYALEHSKRQANLTHTTDNNPTPESNTDMETLSQLCVHASQDTTYKNMRHIKNVISETKIRNPLSIQPEAWKLLVETFGRSGMQEYMDKRKAKEQGDKEKVDTNPNQPKPDRPYHNSPPITRTQYPSNKTARANSESSDKDEERKVCASLQKFYSKRFAKVTRKVHAGTTTLANTVQYNRLIFDSGADTSVIGRG